MTIPRATARLQLHKDFNFDRAAEVVPYYAALGISHIYASPILTARSGSTHGYDIVDPTRINPELGGEEGLQRLVDAIRAAGMGLILDIVPNHMGVGPENPWWQHVLEWGQASPYAQWFDIDWHPADETLHGKVMAPFLGQPYGDALAAGEITLKFDDARGKLFVAYYSHAFPVTPGSYGSILRAAGAERLIPAIATFEEGCGEDAPLAQQNANTGFGLLRELGRSAEGRADIDAALTAHAPQTPQGQEALHAVLEEQHYRLAWWRCAADGINWRRFFEVTDLAGVRVEQDDVFEATHALIFRLYATGLIDGVRIDHVDGLADPGAYCRKLRRRLQALSAQRPPELPPDPAYIVVEKILAPDEQLRTDWEIDGTSGYDFMDRVGALLHDPAGAAPLSALWTELTGRDADFHAEVRQARRQLLANNLAGEFQSASRALHALARTDLRTRDFSFASIKRVFGELLLHFPVYRTYAGSSGHDALDQMVFDRALALARQTVDRTEAPLLDVIARWLGGAAPRDSGSPKVRALHQKAINRFQQLTPPLAAKSVEDTAFYRYGRLLSRNEVGSDPAQFSIGIQEFHEANRLRAERFPHSMLATATHDHKRGEDVRARLAVLSEVPDVWAQTVRDWMQLNSRWRSAMDEGGETDGTDKEAAPHPADELMLYQMLVGAWPVGLHPQDSEGVKEFAARIAAWQTKALREAKQVSGWVLPNEEYEAACRRFLLAILDAGPDNQFLPDLAALVEQLLPAGAINSLSQAVLRMTSPGVPDLYQGTDFWDFSLVDPDNRRPVDYPARVAALNAESAASDAQDWLSGRLKQRIVHRTLQLRAGEPALFARGAYQPLEVSGPARRHLVAFARRLQDCTALVLATRLPQQFLQDSVASGASSATGSGWAGTAVIVPDAAGGTFTEIYTGKKISAGHGRIAVADVLAQFPVAVLVAA